MEIESERRLMYVMMTRAKDKLYIMCRPETSIGKDGKQYDSPVSRFVGELK
jgi:superfamily I DNA/RNA helicase